MRNHHHKTRDIARSALPSSARWSARKRRAIAHGRERTRVRVLLRDLRTHADPDDFEGDLAFRAGPDLRFMVASRRMFDTAGILYHWADRTVAADPALAEASRYDQLDHLAGLLGTDLAGRHAVAHLRWHLGIGWEWMDRLTPPPEPPEPLAPKVTAIVDAGLHGELNSRLHRSAALGYLAGRHDIEAFAEAADDATRAVVDALHAERCAGGPPLSRGSGGAGGRGGG